jgi:hypothetical protein
MPIDETNNNLVKTPDLSELITLDQASKQSGLSSGHLRLLVARDYLWGIKLGRNWFTTSKALTKYLETGHKPGPKPRKHN